MTIQQIVTPEKIEPELLRLWATLSKEKKMRASLFNLIVFNRLSLRTDYIRNIVQKIVEKFPCRILFVSQDPDPEQTYLKTAISVVIPTAGESTYACDQIDIGVAGSDLERVPFLLLPHIVPDLPVYLLWGEDPSQDHPLFLPFSSLATRIIFDSESTDHLLSFAKKVLQLYEESHFDVADLNWARTEGWRDLIASLFTIPQRQEALSKIRAVKLCYNAQESAFFCHLKIQAMYFLSWLASRLQWKVLSGSDEKLLFAFASQSGSVNAKIEGSALEGLRSGAVISVDLQGEDLFIHGERIREEIHQVLLHVSSQEACDLPCRYMLGKTVTGQSLVKEICMKGTSRHYLDAMKKLLQIGSDVEGSVDFL